MRKLFQTLQQTVAQEDAVLVTVVASSGSTPRGAGAMMLVTAKGRISGTIGGGAVEYQSEQQALKILRTRTSDSTYFLLRKNDIRDLGMVCGGDVHVYFRYIPAQDQHILTLSAEVEAFFENGEHSWLINDITQGIQGDICVYGIQSGLIGTAVPQAVLEQLQAKPMQIEADGHTYYTESLFQPGKVYIFGGGHVAQALVPALAAVDFSCIILEDRLAFCARELFPGVQQTQCIDNQKIAEAVQITDQDYVVIMTRGHKDDQTVLAQVLTTPAHYIGVIGSRRKSATVFANLRKMGFSEQDFKRVHTPIGLDIQAETPAEIAVSIAAQLIAVRAHKR